MSVPFLVFPPGSPVCTHAAEVSVSELDHPPMLASAEAKAQSFHSDIVREVREAIGEHHVVVVGMGWNPHVKRARKALDAAGIAHHYLEYGNYAGDWKPRLAIKMWSRWPTFPQVYLDGALLGGADETEAAIAEGTLK